MLIALIVCFGLAWASSITVEAASPQTEATTPPNQAQSVSSEEPTTSPALDLVRRYCITCHNRRQQEAGLMLDQADAIHVANSAEIWEKVIVKLRSSSMPPVGRVRPDKATYDAVASWLETELDKNALVDPNPGKPALHRLNRVEYSNAIRDLLAIEIEANRWLPADGQAYGFDNNAEALSMTPALMDRYVSASVKLARDAIGDATVLPGFERYTAIKQNPSERTYLWQTEQLGEDFPLGSRGGIARNYHFPVDGEYEFRIRLEKTYQGEIRGLNKPNKIYIYVDGVRVADFKIGAEPEALERTSRGAGSGYGGSNYLHHADEALLIRVPIQAGMRQVVATFAKTEGLIPEGPGPDRIPIWSHNYDGDEKEEAIISALLIGGPYNGRVEDSPSRQRIFTCYPASPQEETTCATTILSTIARRAYRRPVSDQDLEVLLGFYEAGLAEGGFESGIRSALERILISPDFLFRVEAEATNDAPGQPFRLSDIELASRLSFFLWSSIPDDELLSLAEQGQLENPAILEQQVRRMLADQRSRDSLVDNFFGQWLQIRNVWLLTPDANRNFPWFDDNLRVAFVKEMELFLQSQLEEDRSVVDLLTANETFVNERLAQHYGVPNVYGSNFQRITLSDENRWGLLGKAAILSVTSYPNRTAPTIRGKWLLENILNAPPPAPPPNVPELVEDERAEPKSMREKMEQHRGNPVCASCHAVMDPLGFSLENFDALGAWRTTDGSGPIDASGVLLDGTKFEGPIELRQRLVAQKELFLNAVTEKLITYALGRNMEYYDAPAIRKIVKDAATDDYQWSSVILGIVKSLPFQMRRSES
jgi:mono/diheme cytochrome c family protein